MNSKLFPSTLVFIFVLLFSKESQSRDVVRNKTIDSLQNVLKIVKEDTSTVRALYRIAIQYYNTGAYSKADSIAQQAVKLAEKLNFKKGIAPSLNLIGTISKNQGNYSKALDSYFKALKIDEELKDKGGIAKRFGNIGIVYLNQGDYPKALDYYFKALKIAEELGNKNGIAANICNIGLLYYNQGNYPKALDYDFKALKMAEEIGNKNQIGTILGNIGIVYTEQKDYSKALDYYFKALKIDEELGNKNAIARHFGNIGNVYLAQGVFPKALDYYFKTFEISKELGDKNQMAISLGNTASVYISMKKYHDAYNYLYRAIALSDSIGSKDNIKEWYINLSQLYEKSNIPLPDSTGGKLLTMEQMRLHAMYYYKRSVAIRDTLFSEENKKQLVRKEMSYEFEKKEVLAKAEQEVKEQKARREKEIVYGLLFLLIIVCMAIVWFFIQRRKVDKIKAIQEKEALEKNKFELELKWFNSELKALRSQMNPHFIFNCMASIQRFMLQNDSASAAKFLSKFARLIRSILENSEQAFISLDKELKMLEDYLDLEKLRFGKKFNYFISVENSINPELIEIPSMLIQPFIENSIIHGIGPKKDETGRIDITFKMKANVLHCEIIDNGVGRKKAKEIKSQMGLTHKSFGISILNERLELINAKENIDVYSHIIDMEDDNHASLGTKVELSIPLRNRKLQ